MRRRSRAGGEPAKAHRRKTEARKSHVTSKAERPNSSSSAREETKVARLIRERDEAFQQQRATADLVLHVQPPKGCAIVLTERPFCRPSDPNWELCGRLGDEVDQAAW